MGRAARKHGTARRRCGQAGKVLVLLLLHVPVSVLPGRPGRTQLSPAQRPQSTSACKGTGWGVKRAKSGWLAGAVARERGRHRCRRRGGPPQQRLLPSPSVVELSVRRVNQCFSQQPLVEKLVAQSGLEVLHVGVRGQHSQRACRQWRRCCWQRHCSGSVCLAAAWKACSAGRGREAGQEQRRRCQQARGGPLPHRRCLHSGFWQNCATCTCPSWQVCRGLRQTSEPLKSGQPRMLGTGSIPASHHVRHTFPALP